MTTHLSQIHRIKYNPEGQLPKYSQPSTHSLGVFQRFPILFKQEEVLCYLSEKPCKPALTQAGESLSRWHKPPSATLGRLGYLGVGTEERRNKCEAEKEALVSGAGLHWPGRGQCTSPSSPPCSVGAHCRVKRTMLGVFTKSEDQHMLQVRAFLFQNVDW